MFDGLLQFVACRIRNRRMPNGTYGGVRGRKMKVGGNDYIIFLLLDFYRVSCFYTSMDRDDLSNVIRFLKISDRNEMRIGCHLLDKRSAKKISANTCPHQTSD